MAAEEATVTAAAPDPRLRGFALAWRLALVALLCAAMLVLRLDMDTILVFAVAVLIVLYRMPRAVRLIRRRDFVSASPWLVLAIGTVAASIEQGWAKSEAHERFQALVAQAERDPCRAEAALPPRIRAGLIDYPMRTRMVDNGGTLRVMLFLNIDETAVREIKLAGCPPRR